LGTCREANGTELNKEQQHAFMLVPVPEPETCAMMLAGFGFIGGLAHRRKQHLVTA
jgi:hypothetical protein